jgi:hypothetical protein
LAHDLADKKEKEVKLIKKFYLISARVSLVQQQDFAVYHMDNAWHHAIRLAPAYCKWESFIREDSAEAKRIPKDGIVKL